MESESYIDYSLFDPEWRVQSQGGSYQYSPRDALALALSCSLARENVAGKEIEIEQAREEMLQKWGFNSYEPFEATHTWDIDTQGFLASNDKRILIAFRASDSKQDWRANFQALKKPGPFNDGEVHGGFQDAFLPVTLDIGRLIERYDGANKEIWITGHSLGAAHAVLLASLLVSRGLQPTGLYTFGAPRIGDKRFKHSFDTLYKSISFRVVNEHDLVPHIPFEGFFSHAGKRMILRNDSDEVRSDEAYLWEDLKANMWGWLGRVAGNEEAITAEDYHRLATRSGYIYQLRKDLGLLAE